MNKHSRRISLLLTAISVMTVFSVGMGKVYAASEADMSQTARRFNISIKEMARQKKMQTYQTSTAWYDLKTNKAVRHYPQTKRFDTTRLAYKQGMWFYLDNEAYQKGEFHGVIANKVFEVNTANGKAVFGSNYVSIRNNMPLTQHRTSGGQCTSSRLWHQGMNNEMVKIIQRIELHLGKHVKMKSAARSYNEQLCLWNAKGRNPSIVARPGTSRHESGLAIDVEQSFYQQHDGVMRQFGLCTPVAGEPWHYEPCWAR